MNRTRSLLAILGITLLAGATAWGQDLSGSMEGTVTDPAKAMVPGAKVMARHVDTNITYQATTSENGRFAIPKARLGRYTITVEAPGFRRAVVQDVVVQVGGIANVNVALQLGELQSEVVVTAETSQELVNTVSAEIGSVVDPRQVLELPLNGRNAAELAVLQAGTYYETTSTGEGTKLIFHGQRHRSINFTLDGVDTQDNLNRASSVMINQPLVALTSENVQEFRVITGISSAEFGRGGAQITAVTRAGSNRFRGSIFEFHRNDIFNANIFFNNTTQPAVERPKLIRNQFGGRIGGPIWKDKAFFFFGYQQTRESRGIPVLRTVYTAEARAGTFRYLDNVLTTPENVAANASLIRVIKLLECSATVMTRLSRFCVDSRFNATNPATGDPFITGDLFAGVPLPNNFDVGDGLNTGGFRFNAKTLTFEHLPSFRLDYRVTPKHLFYGSVNYIDRNIVGDFINARETVYPAFGPQGSRTTLSRSFSGALISNFTPQVVNEFRVGRLGGENAFPRIEPFPTPFTLDLNDISDPYNAGGGISVRDNVTLHVRDVFTWVRGNHQWKMGSEWRHRSVDNVSTVGLVPTVNFSRTAHAPLFNKTDLRAVSQNTSGAFVTVTDIKTPDLDNAGDLINNLVGAIGSVSFTYNATSFTSGYVPGASERRKIRDREVDAFAEDVWRIGPRLTLSLGLRWEFSTVPIETNGLALIPEGGEEAVFGVSGRGGFFTPGLLAGTPCAALDALPMARTTANVTTLITGCATRYVPGGSNNGRPFWKDDYNNFAPILGLAWDPFGTGKTSIRAGFRVSYIQDVFAIIADNIDDNEGLQVTQVCDPTDGNCITNTTFLRNIMGGNVPVGAPSTLQVPAVRTILDSSTIDFRTYANDLSTAYYSEFTLSVQRELFKNWAMEVRYVGNRGRGLRRVADFNEININSLDPTSGQTFLQSFLIAQQNLAACQAVINAGGTCTSGFDFNVNITGSTLNPLMTALIAGEPTRIRMLSALMSALEFNQPGQFVHRLTQVDTSAPASGQARIRGGSWWGAVLQQRFPVNFFQVNPFVGSARAMVNDGFSNYNALEVEVRRRPVGGFAFQANYTFQRALADFDGDENTLLNDVRPSSARNPKYSTQEYTPRHIFNGTWIYDLPFGRGQRWNPQSPTLGRLVGGWQYGGIINWRSGRPFSILSGVGTFHRSAVSAENTVNLSQPMGIGDLRNLMGIRTINNSLFYFDPCLSSQIGAACNDPNAVSGLFQLPNPGELGQLPQALFFGPRRFAFDFNLVKRTRVTESIDMEFRFEVFNAFNNANFGLPETDIFSPSFGQILVVVTRPREIQFALKVNF